MEQQAALKIQTAWRSHKRRAAKLEHDMIYKENLCMICGSNDLEENCDRCTDCIRLKYNMSKCTECDKFRFTIDDLCMHCRNDDEESDDDACKVCGDTDKCYGGCLSCIKEREREDRIYGYW